MMAGRSGCGYRGACGRWTGRSGMAHPIRVGVGGWSFEPWDETFYPAGPVEGEAAAPHEPHDDGAWR